MTVASYMDHHVNLAITYGLRERQVDASTTIEDGTADWDDDALLARATEYGRVFFSQDSDLLAIASNWQEKGRSFTGLIYAHQLAITVGQAITDLEMIAKVCDVEDMKDRVEFLPL